MFHTPSDEFCQCAESAGSVKKKPHHVSDLPIGERCDPMAHTNWDALGQSPETATEFQGIEIPHSLPTAIGSHVARLARSPRLADRASAIGLVARLSEYDLPIPPFNVGLVEQQACVQAYALVEELFAVEALDGSRVEATRELAYQRDDLESIWFVLLSVGAGSLLSQALRHLDDLVRVSWSNLPSIGEFEDERLSLVAELEPNAWWGFWFN